MYIANYNNRSVYILIPLIARIGIAEFLFSLGKINKINQSTVTKSRFWLLCHEKSLPYSEIFGRYAESYTSPCFIRTLIKLSFKKLLSWCI